MREISSQALIGITKSHTVEYRCIAYTPTMGPVVVPLSGGQVVSDSGSVVRTVATLECDPRLWGTNYQTVLSPWGTELTVEYGVQIPGYPMEWINIFYGMVTKASRTYPYDSDAKISVTAESLERRLQEDRFDSPKQTLSGATVVSEITRLIKVTLPEAQVIDRTGSTTGAAILEMNRERMDDGITPLAKSIAAEVYAGTKKDQFYIVPTPTLENAPVWYINAGEGGVFISRDEERTRDNVANRIVVMGIRTDGTQPVLSIVEDNNPLSPTFFGGPYGKIKRFYASPLLTTTAQALATGRSILAKAKGFAANGSITSVTNPALEAGDVISVGYDNQTIKYIIDSVSIPLDPKTAQQITTRSEELPQEA